MSDPWIYFQTAIEELKTKIKEKYDDTNENVLNAVKKWVEGKRFDYTADELTKVIDEEIKKQKLKFAKGNVRPLRTYSIINNNDIANTTFQNPTPPTIGPNRDAIRAGKRTRKNKQKKTKKRRARSHKRR